MKISEYDGPIVVVSESVSFTYEDSEWYLKWGEELWLKRPTGDSVCMVWREWAWRTESGAIAYTITTPEGEELTA